MPEHSTVTSASATQDDAHYSPRLTNDDLAPVRQQTGAGTTFFFLDVGRAQHGRLCGGGQLLYAGHGELAGIDLFAGGHLHRAALRQPVAKPSQLTGVPYAVICRQAFGVLAPISRR